MKPNAKAKTKVKHSDIIRYRLIFGNILLFIIFVSGYCVHSCLHTVPVVQTEEPVRAKRTFPTVEVAFPGGYQRTFNDMQDVQYQAAMVMGVDPVDSQAEIDSLLLAGSLVQVEECLLYETEHASYPYLVPDAKDLLDAIACRFQERIREQRQLRLTSCLRTGQMIESLRRRNLNSIKNSCHLYGTTFDISYRYLTLDEKAILAQVLYELQQAGHCYVKYEYKQPCFHITVRPPQ